MGNKKSVPHTIDSAIQAKALQSESPGQAVSTPKRRTPSPIAQAGGVFVYNSTASTSATNRAVSSPRNAVTRSNTEPEKQPTSRKPLRSESAQQS